MAKDRRYRIAVLPGDGTGPEVVREGLKVLEAAQKACGFKLDLEHYDLGGDRYLSTGDILPDSVSGLCREKLAQKLAQARHSWSGLA